ncbi:MAG: hypothetical protein ABIL58_11505 [Pseudomonadota bacterium]
MSAYPLGNKIDNETGWLFSTIARYLQDKNQVDFKKVGNRSFLLVIGAIEPFRDRRKRATL